LTLSNAQAAESAYIATHTFCALQEIVDENAEHVVVPQQQYDPSAEVDVEGKEYVINYGQIYLSKPTMTEADGETCILFPKEARLRNLT